MRFKSNKVWLALAPDGQPLAQKDKFLIKYQLDQDYEYWVHPDSVHPLEDPAEIQEKRISPRKGKRTGKTTPIPAATPSPGNGDRGTVSIYTDGASSGNPGPSGIGVVMQFGKHKREISRHIGRATNNIAELEAIKTGLLELKKTNLPIKVFTDSQYAYGVLKLGWKAKKNRQLVDDIKKLISRHDNLELVHVRGHQGLEGNERADQLATAAAKQIAPKK
jgi:ribonuclease HI